MAFYKADDEGSSDVLLRVTLKNAQVQGRTLDLRGGVLFCTLSLKSNVLTPQMGIFQCYPVEDFLRSPTPQKVISDVRSKEGWPSGLRRRS